MYVCDQADHKHKPKSTTFGTFDQKKLLRWLGQQKQKREKKKKKVYKNRRI